MSLRIEAIAVFAAAATIATMFATGVAGAPEPAEASRGCMEQSPNRCLIHHWTELPDGRRVECLMIEHRNGVSVDCNWPDEERPASPTTRQAGTATNRRADNG